MKNKLTLSLAISVFCLSNIFAQGITSGVPDDKKYYVGSSLWVLIAQAYNPSPEFYQLNLGYRLDAKNSIGIEFITWKYPQPLGIPYGRDYEAEKHNFPGEVQDFGAGVSYQRFLWKGLYGQAHIVAFKQNYLDLEDEIIQSGFQLFNTFRIGYHIEFFNNRAFIEPSVAMTWWPVNTNMPESFQVLEDKWNKFFIGEPGLHFGVNF